MRASTWLGVLASLISIGAGLYLLSGQSASADTTVFDALMHGIGAYCIARGVWMLSQIQWRSDEKTVGVGKSFRLERPRGNADAG